MFILRKTRPRTAFCSPMQIIKHTDSLGAQSTVNSQSGEWQDFTNYLETSGIQKLL